MLINNETLLHYITLDKRVKADTKERDNMKDVIKLFLQGRGNKQFITTDAMAYIKKQKKSFINVPEKEKEKYKDTRTEIHLKVELKV